MIYPDISFVPLNYCVCVNIFFFPCVSIFGMSVFLRAIHKKIMYLLQWFWRMLIMALAMLLFQEVPGAPRMPTPWFARACFLPQPQQPFPPSEQSHAGNCFSLCKMKKRWKRTGGVRTNAQRLGLPKAHRLPIERYFLPQQQSRSVPLPPWPCWRFPAPKCSISCSWSPPLLSMRVKTAGRSERKKREFTSFCKLIGAMRTLPALLEVRSRSLWSKLFSHPDLSGWKSLQIFQRHILNPTLQCVPVENSYIGSFSTNRRFNPLNFLMLCACVSLIKRNYFDFKRSHWNNWYLTNHSRLALKSLTSFNTDYFFFYL